MHIEFHHEVCIISIDVIRMGADITLCIYGGKAHVGTCVMALPRPSLSGKGVSSTVSCLNRIGHLDDAFASVLAKAISSRLNCVVVCSCGIHVNNATEAQIESLLHSVSDIVEVVLSHLKGE